MIEFMSYEMQTWLRKPSIKPLLLVELDFVSGTVRTSSGAGDAIYQGTVYKGIGQLGTVGQVKQGDKIQPYKLRLTLTGLSQELAATAMTERYQNRLGTIYFAAVDDFCQIVCRDILFAGRMDVMNVHLGRQSQIQLDLNSRGVDWKNPRNARYTDADQQARFPGDKFFEFVSQMAEKELHWGQPGTGATSATGGTRGGNSRGNNQRAV